MFFLLDTCHYLEMCCCHYARSENDAHSRQQADSQFPEFMCPDVIKMVNTLGVFCGCHNVTFGAGNVKLPK